MDYNRCDTTEANELALQHIDGECSGHAGVDGIATGLQDLEPGLRGPVMPRHHHVLVRHDVGAARAGRGEQSRGVHHVPSYGSRVA